MSNQIEFKAGTGIRLDADAAAKNITIKTTLTQEQINKLSGVGGDSFITRTEVETLIANSSGGSGEPAPENFPKFFTTSTNDFVIPKTGRYRISMVGGGGGGASTHQTSSSIGKTGAATTITFLTQSYSAAGGNPGTHGPDGGGSSNIPFDGTKGSVKGGNPGQPGENGAGNGGLVNIHYGNKQSGGGGGSPLNYNIADISGNNGVYYDSDHVSAYGGKGYGAGGGGGGNGSMDPNGNCGGGASGYLIIKETQINENTNIKISIGAGGRGGSHGGGAGAHGAVLIEWIGN